MLNPDGGPVFPQPVEQRVVAYEGMLMRDWFAGQALQGLLAAEAHPLSTGFDVGLESSLASLAWLIADAMIRARERE